MKNKIVILAIFIITAVTVGFYPSFRLYAETAPPAPETAVVDAPVIQLAILLDTSSSMDGLIHQTREQLWQVVNTFADSTHHGQTPELQVAVYEYGNDGISAQNGHIRKLRGLTTELDEVSQALFSLTTDGGEEYCGYVISMAVKELAWSDRESDIRAIFIAGNEPFTQGPVEYKQAITEARKRGITVNTIHAGSFKEGAESGWKDGAMLAGGEYMNIDHNHKVVHITAPQDKRLAELNTQLNSTYIPYGTEGKRKHDLQLEQDMKSESVSSGLMAKRAKSKASKLYKNSTWDLVDAVEQGEVKVTELKEEALPAPMAGMSSEERTEYVMTKQNERNKIKEEIKKLSEEREAYVTEKRMEKPQVNTMDQALVNAVRKQGEEKNYSFK
ncbi:MAG: VWA domain-containing protein [Chromatiales bacterium]|nr:VWA domain-containing protein [Chromatiales bacterium]